MIEVVHDPTLTIQPSYSYPPGDLTPKCGNGHIGSLDRDEHTVDAAGVVTPSVVCPTDECGWHENIRLLDWPPPRQVKPEPAGFGGLV